MKHSSRLVHPVSAGAYQLKVRDGVEDLTGLPLDGDFNGTPEGDFSRNFAISAFAAAGSEFRVNSTTLGSQETVSFYGSQT